MLCWVRVPLWGYLVTNLVRILAFGGLFWGAVVLPATGFTDKRDDDYDGDDANSDSSHHVS